MEGYGIWNNSVGIDSKDDYKNIWMCYAGEKER